jgi:Bacterial regulatory proteins, tetR family
MQETPLKGSDTREHILDVAEAAVLEKGFAATSIEELIAVGITKSGFFYHFKDKNELAKALTIDSSVFERWRYDPKVSSCQFGSLGSPLRHRCSQSGWLVQYRQQAHDIRLAI